jgi:transcriptional regulator with GAF, ATPase, and Fis domain
MDIFLEFLQIFQNYTSLKDYYQQIALQISKRLDSDFVAVFISNEDENYLIVNDEKSTFVEEITQKDELLKLFKKQKVISPSKTQSKLFLNSDKIKAFVLIPLISKNHLFGFIAIGKKEKYDFTKDEELLTNIGLLQSCSLFLIIKYEKLREHNEFLQETASKVRHDLRNHLQVIAMSNELLRDTNTPEEQNKFMDMINRGLTKANTVISDQIAMKSKFTAKLDEPFGLFLD